MRRCRFAQYDETLWLDVLRHYTAKGDECATQIQELLELIEESRALPPLMVVEALASGPDTTLRFSSAEVPGGPKATSGPLALAAGVALRARGVGA